MHATRTDFRSRSHPAIFEGSGELKSRRRLSTIALTLAMVLALLPAFSAQAAGNITIVFNAGYNLVVDSNVCSPPTYAPRIATNGVGFCNYGDAPLSDVVVSVGDFAARTPGVYPARDALDTANDIALSSPCLSVTAPLPAGVSSLYSLTHLGDQIDSVRYVGDLGIGECSWQYWSFTYPRLENGQSPGSGCDSPVWCATNDPDDDLWLEYDVWAVSAEGPAANDTRQVTMRNEISASANKIYPNGGVWFNDPTECEPGETVTTNGVNYELGVVNQGFDNDGDGAADYNAWLQPIGDEGWNPACFRLVRTSGQLTIKDGGDTSYLDFTNQLYFDDNDGLTGNSGVTGTVYYEFMCLGGTCAVPLTPYQEAASGSDNEKFAGDYGGGDGLTLRVSSPVGDIDKSVVDSGTVDVACAPATATVNGIAENCESLNYTIPVTNTGTKDLGRPDLGMPLAIRDSIPAGTTYVISTIAADFSSCTGVTINNLYSYDDGLSWSSTEPIPGSNVTDLQWRFLSQLPAGCVGEVSFDARVDNPYVGDPVILNTATAHFGDSPPFDEATVGIPVAGLNTIGDTVFADDGGTSGFLAAESNNGIQDGGVSEGGIGPVTITLWWDRDSNGEMSDGDIAVRTTATDGTGAYSLDLVPDGDWLVVVDTTDPDLPDGYRVNEPPGSDRPSPDTVAISDLGVGDPAGVTFNDADFGFGPTIVIEKTLSAAGQCGENNIVKYELEVSNVRSTKEQCSYTAWGETTINDYSVKLWDNQLGATGANGPDGSFAQDDFSGGSDVITLETFNLATIPGTIQKVEALFWVYLDGAVVNDDATLELRQATALIADNLPTWDNGDDVPIVPECNDTLENDGDGLTDYPNDTQCTSATFGTEDGFISEALNTLQPSSTEGGILAWDITGANPAGGTDALAWDFADFADLSLSFIAQKSGGLDGQIVYLDAAGFRITTDRLCGAVGDNVSVVMLEDQFDRSLGTTFSSSLACNTDTDLDGEVCGDADDTYRFPNSQDTCITPTCQYADTGRLQWSDVGPLLAGESTVIEVRLAVPDATAGSTLLNTALTCGTAGGCANTFFDGSTANNDSETENCLLQPTFSIGDYVWGDTANFTVQDGGENGIPGVDVSLWLDTNSDGTGDMLLSTITTDNAGAYQFDGWAASAPGEQYLVVVDSTDIPGPFTRTFDRDATLDDQTPVTLVAADVLDADFGYNVPSFVYGNVWYDWNASGTRQAEDHGLGDSASYVQIQLYDCGPDTVCGNGDDVGVVQSTFTDGNGDYTFTGATAGVTYQILSVPPGSYTETFETDTTLDNTGPPFSAIVGANFGGDFAYTQTPASVIGDTLYIDWDGDGIEDAGEGGIANVTVWLYQDNGDGVFDPVTDTQRATDVTDGSGQYLFDEAFTCITEPCGDGDDTSLDINGLPAGNWFVWVDASDPDLPSAFSLTGDPDQPLVTCTTCDGVGSVTTDGVTSVITIDFGYQPSGNASIGDLVWNDADGDGVKGITEVGLSSVTVSLYADSNNNGVLDIGVDTLLTTTLTDVDGSYLFENLYGAAGGVTYFVDVDQTDTDIPTDGGDDFDVATTGDNNPYLITSTCSVAGCSGSDHITVSLTSNTQEFLDADFGFGPGGVIGDTIFEDLNGDGTFTAGTEVGIAGVVVELRDGVCTPLPAGGADCPTDTTDANGQYIFTGLGAGTYTVFVDPATGTLPANYTQTFDPDESPPTCATCDGFMTVTLALGQRIQYADFGYMPPGVVGDYIWHDHNMDGIQDPSEAGIAGVVVELQDGVCDPLPAPNTCPLTTTDTDGLYFFDNVTAGAYTIVVDPELASVEDLAVWLPFFDPDELGVCTTCDGVATFTMLGDGTVAGGNYVFDFGYNQVPLPQITIDKDTSTPEATGNGQITFTTVVRNIGTATAALADIRDDLTGWGSPSCQPSCAVLACSPAFSITTSDASVVRVGAVDPTCGAANNLTWQSWNIPPQEWVSITYTLDVAGTIDPGTYDNTATGQYDRLGADTILDTTYDDDGTLAQDADTPAGLDPEADEDVTITPLPVLGVTKTCTIIADALTIGSVDPGEVIQWDISVTNNGDASASIFAVSDPQPTGTTYVPNSSTLVSYPVWINEVTYADDFDAGTSSPPRVDDNVYPDGDDTSPDTEGWTTTWSGGGTTTSDFGDLSLQIKGSDNPARTVLANTGCVGCLATAATLSFDYKRVNFDSADTLDITVCGSVALTIDGDSDGGDGSDVSDSAYISRTIDVISFLPITAPTDTCEILLNSSAYNSGTGEEILIDNISFNRKERSTAGPDPADAPPLIVPEADDRELLAGETMTMTFQGTPNLNLNGLAEISNTVFVEATELDLPVEDSCALPIANASIGSIAGTIWDDNGTGGGAADGVLDVGEPSLENIRVELDDGSCTIGVDCMVTLTDRDGNYSFTNLSFATYSVVVITSTLPASYVQSFDEDESGNPICGVCDSVASVTINVGSPNATGIDFAYYAAPTPLPVILNSFTAYGDERQMNFEWTTATEIGNVGFALFVFEDGDWRELTDRIEPSRVIDSTRPQAYNLSFNGVKGTEFVLADLDVLGRTRFHGPFTVGTTGRTAELEPIPWSDISSEHRAKEDARRSGRLERTVTDVRLGVSSNGLYRVTYEDLLSAGIDWSGADLRALSLIETRTATKDGERSKASEAAVPIWVDGSRVFGPGAAIEFIGQQRQSLYSDTNLYTLRLDPSTASRISAVRAYPGDGKSVTQAPHTVRISHDNEYTFGSPTSDPWFDVQLRAIGEPVSHSSNITIDHVAPSRTATFKANLFGITDWPSDPDHHVVVKLNSRKVTEVIFNGRESVTINAEIPANWLIEGANDVEFYLPFDDLDVAFDLSALDSFEITYERELRAINGNLEFTASGSTIMVTDLPTADVVIYRITRSQPIERIGTVEVTRAGRGYTATFGGTSRPSRYFVASRQAINLPTIEPDLELADIGTAPADYLIISHPDFISELAPLVALRSRQFDSLRVVDLEQVYAHYSGGMVDATAIADFIRDAANRLGTTHVLLVGGDSYDYKDNLGLGAVSFLPSLYRPTGPLVRFAPADPLYGDVDGDGLPDVAVGRLPVRSTADVHSIIDKIVSYAVKDYNRTLISATDAYSEQTGISFKLAAADILAQMAPGWAMSHADIDELGVAGARDKLIGEINDGRALVQYFGHSSPSLWSYTGLFTTSDAEGLFNEGRPAVVAQWGCWNTYYVEPTFNTMAHKLMLSGDRGAASVLGAATLTSQLSDVALGEHVLPLMIDPGATVGSALVEAKRRLAEEHPEMIDVIIGWTLLGDPGLIIDPIQ